VIVYSYLKLASKFIVCKSCRHGNIPYLSLKWTSYEYLTCKLLSFSLCLGKNKDTGAKKCNNVIAHLLIRRQQLPGTNWLHTVNEIIIIIVVIVYDRDFFCEEALMI